MIGLFIVLIRIPLNHLSTSIVDSYLIKNTMFYCHMYSILRDWTSRNVSAESSIYQELNIDLTQPETECV